MKQQTSQPTKGTHLVIITGLSGAGKSTALRVLEDMGYRTTDNLPINLFEQFVNSTTHSKQNLAVSVDIRNLPNDPQLVISKLHDIRESANVTLLFLDAGQDTLLKRYNETRRIHPLSLGKKKHSLEQALDKERARLEYLKQEADLVIDSSKRSIYDLSERIRRQLPGQEKQPLLMEFKSFGFKYGLPDNTDYIFDVRFLPNPHWEPSLRAFSGLDKPVIEFLQEQSAVIDLEEDIKQFIQKWLPLLEQNNRSYLTIAIGCTGGKHRSVYIAQQLGEFFKAQGKQVKIRHMSIEEQKI